MVVDRPITWEARSVFELDRYFERLRKRQRSAEVVGGIRPESEGIEPYQLAGDDDKAYDVDFHHPFVGIISVAAESGEFLLQQRDRFTTWNPNMVSIFGGQVLDDETLSAAAIREFAEETGITIGPAQLQPMQMYVEHRTKVPVFRALYVVMLDRIPRELRCGEGDGIVLVPVGRAEQLGNLTWLSREDIAYFLDHHYPTRTSDWGLD